MPPAPKMITILKTSAKPNLTKDTKNYLLSMPVPDKDGGGKGIIFVTNDGQIYISKGRAGENGIERADQIRNIHITVEIEKA